MRNSLRNEWLLSAITILVVFFFSKYVKYLSFSCFVCLSVSHSIVLYRVFFSLCLFQHLHIFLKSKIQFIKIQFKHSFNFPILNAPTDGYSAVPIPPHTSVFICEISFSHFSTAVNLLYTYIYSFFYLFSIDLYTFIYMCFFSFFHSISLSVLFSFYLINDLTFIINEHVHLNLIAFPLSHLSKSKIFIWINQSVSQSIESDFLFANRNPNQLYIRKSTHDEEEWMCYRNHFHCVHCTLYTIGITIFLCVRGLEFRTTK